LPHSDRKGLIKLLSSRRESTIEKKDYIWNYPENTLLGKRNQHLNKKHPNSHLKFKDALQGTDAHRGEERNWSAPLRVSL